MSHTCLRSLRFTNYDEATMAAFCSECGGALGAADVLFATGHDELCAETMIYERVYAALDIQDTLELHNSIPFSHLTWDYYDTSLEIKGCDPAFAPTLAQWQAIRALGFSRMWVCYADEHGVEIKRLERYCSEEAGQPRGGEDDGRIAVRYISDEPRYPALASRLRRLEKAVREAHDKLAGGPAWAILHDVLGRK